MASYRPFPPPQSSFGPSNQNPPLPPPRPHFPQNQPFIGSSQPSIPPSSFPNPPSFNSNLPHAFNHSFGPPRPHQQLYHQQQQQFPPYPPPSSYSNPPSSMNLQPLPPPPQPQPPSQQQQPQHPLYYPSSSSASTQYNSQFDGPLPPPPPVPPPPSSPPPPPPPPSLPPPPPPPPIITSNSIPAPLPSRPPHRSSAAKEVPAGGVGVGRPHEKVVPPKETKQQKPVSLVGKGRPHLPPQNGGPVVGRVETEEERRLRKKREYEKQREEEKRRQLMKQAQAQVQAQSNVAHKAPMVASASGVKVHGSIAGSRMGERRNAPFLGGERIDNRLKKPTTFLCKLKFRNELPDPTAQPKLLSLNTNKDQTSNMTRPLTGLGLPGDLMDQLSRYTKYTITSIEKMHKPKLFVEPDVGIPLDLLDISVYNAPKIRPPLAPEDEELLRDTECVTPVKQDGIRRKERPTDKGVSWLVKTQYISPLSMDAAKMSLTEKQAKELRETREGRNLNLDFLNNREKQIQTIEESFKAAKLRPVHQTNPNLEPVEIMPLLPDFSRWDDKFVTVAFDSEPTADSELYSKLDRSVRDEHEAQAIMKSFIMSGSDPSKSEKFLAYMVPAPDELSKDIYDEHEDVAYTWVREYQWDVRGDDADDPTTFLVNLDEETARYLPLPTRLVLHKKRAKEGRSGDEVEHYPVPSRVTVRHGATVNVVNVEEIKDSGGLPLDHSYANPKEDSPNSKRVRSDIEDDLPRHKIARGMDMDHFSGEEDMSD